MPVQAAGREPRPEESDITMRHFLWFVVIACVGGAYAAGYLPEHRQRTLAESETAGLRSQLADAQARVRAAGLLGELLALTDAVAAMNYGEAQRLSSHFFDEVREEAAVTQAPALRSALNALLQDRDLVTSALARGESGALERLRMLQARLRESLGYPVAVPAEPAATPPAPVGK